MKLARHLKQFALFATFVATLAGCGGSAPQDHGSASDPLSDASPFTVRIAYSPNIVLPQPLLLKQNPSYGKLDPKLKFEYTSVGAGPAVIEALRAGIADVGYSGIFPPLKAYLKAGDIVLVAGAATGGTELVVAKNSPYKTIADLKGKSVGVNQLGSTVDCLVRGALIDGGLKPDIDVQIKPIDPPLQADALKRGDVAAVAAPAPWPSQVILGGGRPLLNWKSIFDNGNYAAGVLFASKKFAAQHPQALKRFAALHRAINVRLNANRSKANAQVLAAWSADTRKQLSPEVARAAFATITFTDDPDMRGVALFNQLAVKTGISRKAGDINGFLVDTGQATGPTTKNQQR